MAADLSVNTDLEKSSLSKHRSDPRALRWGSLTRRIRALPTIVVVFFLIWVLSPWTSLPFQAKLPRPMLGSERSQSAYNGTLGFEKIFALNLPERTDKRDYLTLAAAFTGLDLTFEDGVLTKDVSAKVVPEDWKYGTEKGILGSRQAHLKVLNKIVHEGIQSALILEDDTDWDYSVHHQLSTFAESVTSLQNGRTKTSPYGDEWDLLWLGHCRVGAGGPEAWPVSKISFVHNDPTVPPVGHRYSIWLNEYVLPEQLHNDTRIVFKAWKGYCSFAYAVTQAGARKILSTISLQQDTHFFDLALNIMCKDNIDNPFHCYSVYPPLFSSHRPAGSSAKDSDLQSTANAKDQPQGTKHDEYTWDIVHSAMQNIPRLAAGAKTVKSQWPNDTLAAERHIDEPWPAHRELRNVEWGALGKSWLPGINIDRCETDGRRYQC